MKKTYTLLILDGYGLAESGKGNAISLANTENIDKLFEEFPNTTLTASGIDVGLPDGQFGNSEVGHTNIGAGRVVYQDFTRISKSIKDGDFFTNPSLVEAFSRCSGENAPALHLMGLLSDGGVHSHISHLVALIKLAEIQKVEKVYIHAFLDGRDTPPQKGAEYVEEISKYLEDSHVKLGTVIGRYYAMDRDNRWDRIERAYNALTAGVGEKSDNAANSVRQSYERDVTDEFVEPIILNEDAKIKPLDSVVFFNFRPDRAREITRALIEPTFTEFNRPMGALPLAYVTFTQYDAGFADYTCAFDVGSAPIWQGHTEGDVRMVRVAYPIGSLDNVMGEYLSKLGKSQLRLAETEKYAHVTFFFNGGREEPFMGEDRILVPSPKVATYDLKPEMSAREVANKAKTAILSGEYDVIIMNLANCDMVGHTGMIDATISAVEVVDECVGIIRAANDEMGGVLIVTADHGNADVMTEKDGSPMTAHTSSPVPFIVCGAGEIELESGRLCDISPTILSLMGIKKPEEMEGVSLVK